MIAGAFAAVVGLAPLVADAIPARTFVCTDSQTQETTLALPEVRRAKEIQTGVWLVTFRGGHKEAIQVEPSVSCRLIR